MQLEEYILTVMFFARDYSLRLTAVANQAHLRHPPQQTVKAIPYDDHLLETPDKLQNGPHTQEMLKGEIEQSCPLFNETVCVPRQATIDLGQVHRIDWLSWWPEPDTTNRIPQQWHIDVSLNGRAYIPAYAISRFSYLFGTAYLVHASCQAHRGEISLAPIEAQFIRFSFDNTPRENFSDEWAIELRLVPLNKISATTLNIQTAAPHHSSSH